MRVLHVAPLWFKVCPDSSGGIETLLPRLIASLAALGCEQSLLAPGNSRTSARLYPVGERSVAELMETGEAWELGPYEQHELGRAVELGADHTVVHSHLGWPGFILAQVPGLARKTLHTLHNDITPDLAWYFRRHPDLLLSVVSEFQLERVRAAGARACTLIPNAIEVADFPYSDRAERLLVFLGRMEPQKGPDLAVRVARQLGWPLVLAGPLTDPPFFETQIRPQLDETIRYAGVVDHAAKCELLGRACCTLMPSRWDEPFGLVALESQACGTPVVALARGGLPEVVHAGTGGYLADREDQLADLVAAACTLERGSVREHVTTHFGFEPVARRYLARYEEIARG